MITFITTLPTTQLLYAYNNNVVEFKSDSTKTAVKAIITVSGEKLEITPNPNGAFYYNFKTIAAKLLNDNYFRDTIIPESKSDIVYLDTNAYKELAVTFKVEFEDKTQDTITNTYKFLKAVEQLEQYRIGLSNTDNPKVAILKPFTTRSTKVYHATYFEGYPFDVSMYSDVDRTVTITNKRTTKKMDVDLKKGVNRVFISDGDTNFTFEDLLHLYYGVNTLEIKISNTEILTLQLKKVKSTCGVYLKWFNNAGGWSHFLFKAHAGNRKVKSAGVLYADDNNLSQIDEQEVELGVASQDEMACYAYRVDVHEKLLLEELIESPKVYRYLNCMFQKSDKADWITQRIASKNTELTDSVKKLFEVELKLVNPKRNTITL